MTFETTPRGIFTVFGVSPERAARDLAAAGASMLGTNCGTGPATMIEMVRELRRWTTLPLIAQPNAGLPTTAGGILRYPETPSGFASHVAALVGAGASILGGCCGTNADHVRACAAEVRRIRERRAPPISSSDPESS
jgi:5-methyltetrahydrofolate--homocysteine methyltransferase